MNLYLERSVKQSVTIQIYSIDSCPTCMGPFVNFQVFASRENFPASREGTGEGFFPRVHTNVVDQFVLGLEWSAISGTVLPQTCMVSMFRPPNMVNRQVVDDFMHCRENFIARFLGFVLVFLYPQAGVLLFDRLSHVSQESPRPVGPDVYRVQSPHRRNIEGLWLTVMFRSLWDHMIVLFHAGVNIGGKSESVRHMMSGRKGRGFLESG